MSRRVPVSQAADVARRATAHNSGPTVWEEIIEPGAVILRMSSWPRAREAEAAFTEQGWSTEYLPDDGKGHTLIRVTHGHGLPPEHPLRCCSCGARAITTIVLEGFRTPVCLRHYNMWETPTFEEGS